jgi:class 3 adenylate cyclase/tetratricopeptide (TPR) repeat protein
VDCSNCGTSNEPGRKFCKECGTRLLLVCAVCGTANSVDSKFCGECASPLTANGGRAGAAAQGGATTHAAAMPSGAADTTSPLTGSVAERRIVSVLFADLVAFTAFAEDRDPEDVRETLTRYFDLASSVVSRYGGRVEKFIGDAVMALWGAPVAREDDAERAVRAALELVSAVQGLGDGLSARAGVLTGEAAVTVGTENQGMVAGDLVNTASRLQGVAEAGTVLVGEVTMRAAAQSIAFEPADDRTLKGKSMPVPAYRALRVVAELGGRGRSEVIEAPFVGRDEELRLLKQVLESTGRDRRARLVSVTGPAGIGKSRLVWEFEKYVDGVVESVWWHHGRSPSYRQGVSFWALGEMVRGRAGLAEDDDEATTRLKVAATVSEFVPDEDDRRWVEPALLTLLGVEPAPPGGRDVLFAAWRIFFERIARRGTTVLLFEDLQWADAGLLDFIEQLLEWSRATPILVIAVTRPELLDRRPDWGSAQRNSTTLALEPLSAAEMRALLEGVVPGLSDRVTNLILDRAGGMPLYAVELLRGLIADGRLVPKGNHYRVTGPIDELAVPETLRSLISARLDALPAADRQVLQDAAVLGQTFSVDVLGTIGGRSGEELETSLRDLVRRELLTVEVDPRSPERGQYAFVQSLTREVAYAVLSKRDRRARHLAAARHYEAIGDDELAGVLASHYVAAYESSSAGPEAEAVRRQARIALTAAADRAAALGSHADAVTYYQRASALTDDPRDLAEILGRAAQSASADSDHEQSVELARAAERAAAETGDASIRARAAGRSAFVLIESGDVLIARGVLEAALEQLGQTGDRDEADLLARLARAAMRSGDNDATIAAADRALTIAERIDDEPIVAEALANKAAALGDIGRRRESNAIYEAVLTLAQRLGMVELEIRALHNQGATVIVDDPRLAVEKTLASAALAERVGNRSMYLWGAGTSRWFALETGRDWDEHIAALDVALERAGTSFDRWRVAAALAEYRLYRGEIDADELLEVIAATRSVGDPSTTGSAAYIEGLQAMFAGDPGRAARVLRSTIDAYPGSNFVPLTGLARAGFRLRDVAIARSALDELDADPASGAWIGAARVAVRAGVDALEGRDAEAASGFRSSFTTLYNLGFEFEAARFAVDAAILLGDLPELDKQYAAARAVFERVRAVAYLKELDAALQRSPETANAREVSV